MFLLQRKKEVEDGERETLKRKGWTIEVKVRKNKDRAREAETWERTTWEGEGRIGKIKASNFEVNFLSLL